MRLFVLFSFLLGFANLLSAQAPPLQMKAWAGDSAAMISLSEAYDFGRGVTKNPDSAQYYIQKAAAKGHPDGQYLMAIKNTSHIFDAKKYAAGVALLEKAAAQNHQAALAQLGEIYRSKGTGTVADSYYNLAKSYQYSERAALLGDVKSLRFAAESRLTGTGTTRNDSIAIAFMRRAAVEKKDVLAMVRMGDLYFEGKVNGKPEPFAALEWYRKAHTAPHANIDQRAKADFGLFRVDRLLRQVHNGMMAAAGLSPAATFDYLIRKE